MTPPSSPPASRSSGSWERAAALDRVIDAAIAQRQIVGVVVIVARQGQIAYHRAAGHADRAAGRLMRAGETFRLASMTKAIVSAAALALADRGALSLQDPVTRWLPEFRPRLPDGREPVIRLQHLITHTSGLSYRLVEPPDGPYHRLGVSDGLERSGLTLHENLRRIARAPLRFEPGTQWHYSVGVDVLGGVLERVTGSSLPALIRAIVTGPLGMTHTHFTAPAGTPIATAYADATPEPLAMSDPFHLPFLDGVIVYSPSRAFAEDEFPSGGTGMVGTAEDYLRFLEALRTGGAGVLRPETAAAMTRNATGALGPNPGYGFGLGVQVLSDPATAQVRVPAGTWGWGGVYGTHYWVDPAAALSLVTLTNTAVAGMIGPFPSALQQAASG